jgi:Tol biopolymer transport system component
MATTSSFVDLRTGRTSPLPEAIERSGYAYAVSPDRSMFAFSPCCYQATREAYVANVDGTGLRPITPSDVYAVLPEWAPTGHSVVYQRVDHPRAGVGTLGNLFVTDVQTGRTDRITQLDQTKSWSWWVLWPSFGPGGETVLFQQPRTTAQGEVWDLWSVRVDDGTTTLVLRDAGYGAYAPDGTLAYLTPYEGGSSGDDLWILDERGGTPRQLVHGPGIEWPRWSPDGTRISYGSNDGGIYVVDVATGDSRRVADGGVAEWFDDDTLVVGAGGCPGC